VSAAVDPQSLLTSAECYLCFQDEPLLKLGLLRQILLASNPMADTSPQALLSSANCYLCFGNSPAQLMAMELSLLAQIAVSGGGGGGGGSGGVHFVLSPNDPTSLGPVQGPAITYDDVGGLWVKLNTTLDTNDWAKLIGASSKVLLPPPPMPTEFTRTGRSSKPDTIVVPKLDPPELVPAGVGQSVKSSRKPYWALVMILAALVWLVFSCAKAHGQFPPPIIHSPFTTNAGPVIDGKHLSVTNLNQVQATNFNSQMFGPGALATMVGSVAVGANATSSGQNASAIGSSSLVTASAGTAFGTGSEVDGLSGIALGSTAFVDLGADSGVAIGNQAFVFKATAAAFGSFSQSNFKDATALGQSARTTDTNQIMLGIANGTVVVPGQFIGAGTVSNSFRLVPTNSAAGVIYNPTNDMLSTSGGLNVGAPAGVGAGNVKVSGNAFIGSLFNVGGEIDTFSTAAASLAPDYTKRTMSVQGSGSSYGIAGGQLWVLGLSQKATVVDQGNGGNSTAKLSSPSDGTFLMTTNLILSGTLSATNGFSVLKTNPAPTSVTVGVTAPDYWLWYTNLAGTGIAVPGWINH
jgi:hypothetical protein